MTSSAVVRAEDVHADRTASGARVRILLESESADMALARRLVDVPPGSRFDGIAGPAGELWFVIDGSGLLDIEGHPGVPVRPDQGIWIPPGVSYQLHCDGPADLRLDAVTLPDTALPGTALPGAKVEAVGRTGDLAADPSLPLVRALGDCEVETTGDRHFRVLFGPGQGCAVATQFVGEIPPGRAPDHSHPYDEVVLVLQGQGIMHVGGADHAVSAGSCTHLQPGQPHCLENTGPMTMRVLGVFHPADSPAAKLEARS